MPVLTKLKQIIMEMTLKKLAEKICRHQHRNSPMYYFASDYLNGEMSEEDFIDEILIDYSSFFEEEEEERERPECWAHLK